jgi:ABC-type glycerol-3-phosphate transport system permease component
MAASVAVTVPLMVAAGFIQRRLVEGWGAGAVKG